jgi:hypothetical protein
VYLPQSLARRDDERTLTDYLDRGLRVRGVRLGFVRLRVVTRRPRFVQLEVVDRLGTMTAVTSRGMHLRLPRDQATRHCIILRRVERRWRIAAVRAA